MIEVDDADSGAAQAAKIEKNFEAMRTLPQVTLWTQHGMNDVTGNDFNSGLRDDFDAAAPGPGPARPAWATWMSLDGTRPVEEPVASASGAGGEPPADQPPASNAGPEANPSPAPAAPPAEAASPFAAPSVAAGPDAAALAAPQLSESAAPDAAGRTAPAGSGDAATAASACMLAAPKSFGPGIRVGRRGTVALPGVRLTAAQVGCIATVSIIGHGIHVTQRLAIASGSSRAVRAPANPRRLPARVTIKVAVPTGTRAWRTWLVR